MNYLARSGSPVNVTTFAHPLEQGPDDSWLWGAGLSVVGCLAASPVPTHSRRSRPVRIRIFKVTEQPHMDLVGLSRQPRKCETTQC